MRADGARGGKRALPSGWEDSRCNPDAVVRPFGPWAGASLETRLATVLDCRRPFRTYAGICLDDLRRGTLSDQNPATPRRMSTFT